MVALTTIPTEDNQLSIFLVNKLYINSFAKKGRIPFKLLLKLCDENKMELLLVTDRDLFIGFLFVIHYKELVFILYFAIDEIFRGSGYGSKALQLVNKRYSDKRIILNVESTKGMATNQAERERRKKFYVQHGYKETSLSSIDRGETYEMLIFGGEIEKEEYIELLKYTMGKLLFWLMAPKVIDGAIQ